MRYVSVSILVLVIAYLLVQATGTIIAGLADLNSSLCASDMAKAAISACKPAYLAGRVTFDIIIAVGAATLANRLRRRRSHG